MFWNIKEIQMKRSILVIPLLFAGMLYGQANQKDQEFGSITTSGQSVTFQDPSGSGTLMISEVVTGSPSAMSVVVQGCPRVGVCVTLDTNTSTSTSLRGPLLGGYDKYVVTATWTGTSSVTVYKTGIQAKVGGGGGVTASAITTAIQTQSGCNTAGFVWVPASGTCVAQSGGGGAVSSVNTKTGAVVLSYADVGAEPAVTLSPLAYGAVCDGSSHPASGKYANLAATQVDFSFATAQTNELDWLATQKAINIGAATTTGGTVLFPGKTSCIMDNASSAADGSGTLTLPEANDYLNGGSVVNLVGQGQYSTTLRWNFDLGTGKFAIVDANRIASTAGNMGFVGKLTIAGPGNPSPTVGTFPANMVGFAVGSYKRIQEFASSGFRYGIAYAGGQQRWSDITLMNNGYNIYAQNSTGGLLGDLQWDRIVAKNATLADFAAAHDADFVDLTCIQCYAGYAPYAFFKETNSGAPTNALLMNRTRFLDLKAEFVGNALIADDQNSATSMFANLLDANFDNLWFSWGATFQWGAKGRFALVNVNNASFSKFTNINTSGSNWVPGSVSIFNISNVGGRLDLSGDINALISNANGAAANSIFNNHPGNIFVQNTSTPSWSGYVTTGQSFVTLTSGQFAVKSPNAFFPTSYACIPATGTTSDTPCGVVMHVDGGNTATGAATIFANSGTVTVAASGTFSTTASPSIRTGASGTVTPAANSSDPNSPLIGSVAAIPTTTTPTTISVELNGGASSGGATPASVATAQTTANTALASVPSFNTTLATLWDVFDLHETSGTTLTGIKNGHTCTLAGNTAADPTWAGRSLIFGAATTTFITCTGMSTPYLMQAVINYVPNNTGVQAFFGMDSNVTGGFYFSPVVQSNTGANPVTVSMNVRNSSLAGNAMGSVGNAIQTLTLSLGASTYSYINNTTLYPINLLTPSLGAFTQPTTGNFTVGGSGATGNCNATQCRLKSTTLYGFAVYSTQPTSKLNTDALVAQNQKAWDFLVTNGNTGAVLGSYVNNNPTTQIALICNGTSIEAGQNSGTVACAASLTGLGAIYTPFTVGVPSSFIASQNLSQSQMTQFVSIPTAARRIVYHGNAATNDMANGSVTPQVAWNSLQSAIAQDRCAGLAKDVACTPATNVMIGTMFDRTGQTANHDTWNTFVRGGATVNNYFLCDVAANPLLGADGAASNATNFPDGIHPSIAMQTLYGGIIGRCINSQDGATQANPNPYTSTTQALLPADNFSIANVTAASTWSLPECIGLTGRVYQIENPSAFPVTVAGINSEAVNGGNIVYPNTVGQYKVNLISAAAGGCYWTNVSDVTNAATTIAFSATPAFTSASGTNTITLTGNITSFTVPAVVPGKRMCLNFVQDATGTRTVSGVPATVHGFFSPIGATASTYSQQCFNGIGTQWNADSPGIINVP
jgi:hypothetical protein